MSWLYSQALVAEYSADTSSDGAPSAPSSVTPMPRAYCSPDKMTDVSRLSRFGMTFAPLTDDHGEDLLTWYREDFLARTSASQEKGQGSAESGLGFGLKCLELLGKFDPDSCSWRTPQLSLVEAESALLQTLPRWGIAANGELWELQMSERLTSESESGLLLPTPTANELRQQGPSQLNRKAPSLACRVRFGALWPTPTTQDNIQIAGNGSAAAHPKRGTTLAGAVRFWPTPVHSEARQGFQDRTRGKRGTQQSLTTVVQGGPASQVGGALNPTWTEWLMGWPLGWTDFAPLEMARFQQWLHAHLGGCNE